MTTGQVLMKARLSLLQHGQRGYAELNAKNTGYWLYYSIERFNQTLEYEWLYNSNLSLDPEEFNPRLTEWLIEYNFHRPHQSLGYLAPIEYIEKELAEIHSPVLPMWSASTNH